MKTALALKDFAAATLCTFLLSAGAFAQQAVSVSGHITAEGRPLAGASVRVQALNIVRSTDAAGYYSFLIPSNRVGGQTVVLTASLSDRRNQFVPQSVEIALTGAPIVKDFDLHRAVGPSGVPAANVPRQTSEPSSPTPAAPLSSSPTDTVGMGELSGATDIASALAARFPSLGVVTSPALGGSTSMTYRGPRSFLGSAQPLFVVDGIVQDNTTFASLAQRYGAGGFDYGSPLQDLNTRDIAAISWLTGPDAVARFGSRAANGVAVVTTKYANDGARFAIGASQQFTPESAVRLPDLQNSYGQGLGGKFQFFDGRGHGINDAVDQNWGPPLDGRPLAQASYTEPQQADVRFWNAQPNNVSNFFRSASTTSTNATLQARSSLGALWLGIGQRQSDGLVPESELRRRDARLTFSTRPTPALSLSGTVAVAEMRNDDTPGSGFNQTNPVSQFTRLGRQVDTDSLRANIKDANGRQISWNYAGQNNPYFAELANDNTRDRNHLSGGASATYEFSPSLTGTATAGSDYYRDDRRFVISSGWMGGFPFYASSGQFTQGGFQNDDAAAQRSNAAVRLTKTRTVTGSHWTFFAGADLATIHQRTRTVGIDSVVDVPPPNDTTSTAKAPDPVAWTGHGKTFGAVGGASALFDNGATLGLTLRQEWVSVLGDHQTGATYPAAQGSFDAARALPALRLGGKVDAVNIHAAAWRAGSDATPYAVQTMYAGQTLSGGVTPAGAGLLSSTESIGPETTNAWQIGADVNALNRRLDAGFTLYYEHASDVLVPRVLDTTTAVAANAAKIRNHGVEGFVAIKGGDRDRSFFWNLLGTASLNYNRVEDLGDGVNSVLLGPAQSGVTVEAIKGLPFGELLGFKLRRDPATGALMLRNGLPQADSSARTVLGQSRQNKLFGIRGTLGYRWVALTLAGDAHVGGSIFSATAYNGDVAGTFAETASRPDSGLLVAGIDAATGQANATHVTTEAYYHALGAVQEPWIYSATFFKLRELNLSVSVPTGAFPALPFESARLSFIARNLYTWSRNRNFDPETLLSVYAYPGMELGQLPMVRTVGVQLSVTP